MKLSYIFSQMETSELKQLNCIDPLHGKIKTESYQGIVDVMNQGLVDLHTRFKLKIGTVTVPIDPTVAVYDLTKFDLQVKGRFLQLHDVRDECDRVLPTGGYGGHHINFTSPMTMVVPESLRTRFPVRQIIVQYRSLPTRIGDCFGDIDPEMVDVDLPVAYVWALCLYVASRLHTPVGLQDGTYRVNAFLGLFNAECTRLEDSGMALDYQQDMGHLQRNGWA